MESELLQHCALWFLVYLLLGRITALLKELWQGFTVKENWKCIQKKKTTVVLISGYLHSCSHLQMFKI